MARSQAAQAKVSLSKKHITNSSFLETSIAKLADEKGISIPQHPTVEGLNIVLRLKPQDWRLEAFYAYMSIIPSCCHEEIELFNIIYPKMSMESHKIHFFHLDRSLNKEDVEFLLHNLVKVPLYRTLPSDFTGESIVNGELSDFLTADNYTKVIRFIQNSRTQLNDHIESILRYFSETHLEKLLLTTLELPSIDAFSVNSGDHAYSQLSTAFNQLDRLEKLTIEQEEEGDWTDAIHHEYLYKCEITTRFVDYVKDILARNKEEYYASYLFLGQSSGTGKSRLLRTSIVTEDVAIFLVYVNCKEEVPGHPEFDPWTNELVQYLMGIRSKQDMSDILYSLLSLVFKGNFDRDNGDYFLNGREPGSYSLAKLGIDLLAIRESCSRR